MGLLLLLLACAGSIFGQQCATESAFIKVNCPQPNIYDPTTGTCACAVGYTTGAFGGCIVDTVLARDLSQAVATLCPECDTAQAVVERLNEVSSIVEDYPVVRDLSERASRVLADPSAGCDITHNNLPNFKSIDGECYTLTNVTLTTCTFELIGPPVMSIRTDSYGTVVLKHIGPYKNEICIVEEKCIKFGSSITMFLMPVLLTPTWKLTDGTTSRCTTTMELPKTIRVANEA
jgi:hypothetical protein